MRRAQLHAAAGAVLSTGAPLGLLALRSLLAGKLQAAELARELSTNASTYVYVALSTLLAFTAFGWALGRRADALYASSATDPLTGLANRRAFEQRLAYECARARRYRSQLALLIADVDGLKLINDGYGHRAGDAALQRVAGAIARNLRAADLGARWGGDEFAVLAPSTGAAEAVRLAERICAAAKQLASGPVPVTLSVGVASVAPVVSDPREALLRAADAALYEAKAAGRDRVVAADLGAQH